MPGLPDYRGIPVSKVEARCSGLRHFYTGTACKYGHVELRFANCGQCMGCVRDRINRLRAAARERSNKKRMDYYYKNPNRLVNNKNAYVKATSDPNYVLQMNLRSRVRESTDTAHRVRKAQYRAKWRANNPDVVRRINADRRARKRNAVPPWFDDEMRSQIDILYKYSIEMSAATGIPHEVDHIVPLRGRFACGLHVPGNMQVIPRTANRSKHITMPEDSATHIDLNRANLTMAPNKLVTRAIVTRFN